MYSLCPLDNIALLHTTKISILSIIMIDLMLGTMRKISFFVPTQPQFFFSSCYYFHIDIVCNILMLVLHLNLFNTNH